MSGWNPAQNDQWNQNTSEYDDLDDYTDDDSEYDELEVTAWGDQTVTKDGTTNINVSAQGWESLIDPSVKIKPGGIGSGQLHRKGKNFIPVDEQQIINRRLGLPVPSTSGKKKKKKGSKSAPNMTPRGTPAPRGPPSQRLVPPSSSANRIRQPPASGPWASGQLAETPFWQAPAQNTTTGTFASKYASPAPAVNNYSQPASSAPPARPAANTQNNWAAFNTGVSSAQGTYQPAQPPQAFTQQQPQHQQPAPQPAEPSNSGFIRTSAGSAASKWASPAATRGVRPSSTNGQLQQQPLQPQPYQQPAQPQQPQQPQQSQQQQQQPVTINHRLDTPCLNFNIELTPGVTAKLVVYANDNPMEVVNNFEKDHHLNMSESAKRKFADKVNDLLQQYKPE